MLRFVRMLAGGLAEEVGSLLAIMGGPTGSPSERASGGVAWTRMGVNGASTLDDIVDGSHCVCELQSLITKKSQSSSV